MNPDKICYGCFQEKGEGSICPHCGFDAQATQPYLALPLGTILNGRYMTGKVLGMGARTIFSSPPGGKAGCWISAQPALPWGMKKAFR